MNLANKYSQLTDHELVELIKDNQDYLGEVYNRCQKNSLFYLRKTATKAIDDEVLQDIFQDAIIALYENILKGNFVLTVKIQTYVDRICYNMLLKYISSNKLGILLPKNDEVFIADGDDEIDNSDENKRIALENALEKMKQDGGNCYELITQFWYHKKSMNDLSVIFDHKNADTTKNQKSRCQERLRKKAFNILHII